MSDSNRGDRGALVALALVVAAIVIVTALGWLSNPTDYGIGQPAPHNVEQRQDGKVSELVASSDNFHPWRDTYAQWLMALFSVAATGVSIWAVRLLRSTLRETQAATQATVEANEVARVIGRSQVRAYLSVSDMILNFSDDGIVARVDIKNSGQSPAFKVIVKGRIHVGTIENLAKGGKIASETTSVLGVADASFVAANSNKDVLIAWYRAEATSPFHLYVTNHATRFRFNGHLKWLDVFGAEQTLNFSAVTVGGRDVARPDEGVTGKAELKYVHYPEKFDD
ncbi:MAG: hypothetical protein Q8L53_05645 [Aestuariivirga sp.]|nr:hypothetical protein [Aestuariivirga sp.]